MFSIHALGLVILVASYFSDAAKLVDPRRCQNGCNSDNQCTVNSECIFLDNFENNCGYCVCKAGFEQKGDKCKAIKGYTTPTTTTSSTTTTSTTSSTTTTSDTTTVSTTTTPTTTVPTTTGTTTQSPFPPTPEPLVCSQYACSVLPKAEADDNDPFRVQSVPLTPNPDPSCKRQITWPRPCNMQNGGACYGSYCLTVSPGNDYCICPYYKVDRQCAVDKPGNCDRATGSLPVGNVQLQNKRLRNPSNKDHGSIYGRHFAANVNDCIRLCQWTDGQCRSVNYGPINGANVCELLSIATNEKSILAPWLENADGWTYVQIWPTNRLF